MSLHTSINEKTDRTDQTQCRINKTLQWWKLPFLGPFGKVMEVADLNVCKLAWNGWNGCDAVTRGKEEMLGQC